MGRPYNYLDTAFHGLLPGGYSPGEVWGDRYSNLDSLVGGILPQGAKPWATPMHADPYSPSEASRSPLEVVQDKLGGLKSAGLGALVAAAAIGVIVLANWGD